MIEIVCHDYGNPGCLGVPDERYTMDFSDVEPGAELHWCSHCGPEAHALADILEEAIVTRGKEFTDKLDGLIQEAETAIRITRN